MIGKFLKPKVATEGPAMRKTKSKRRRPNKPGRGALLILSAFLVGSAGLRLNETYGTAVASENAAEPQEAATVAPAPEFEKILAALAEREARIADREAALDTREAALSLAETRIDEKLAELETAEADLRATIALAETASENDLSQLTSVYENMAAEEAAPLFAQMTPDFAAGFLARMRPDLAAAVMAGLEPNTAYEISVILAGRNARVPTE